MEVTRSARNTVVIKPKKLVDPDDLLSPEDEASIRRGIAQMQRGETVPWDDVKKEFKL